MPKLEDAGALSNQPADYINATNLTNLLMLTMLTNQPAKAVDDNKQPAILCCTSAIVFLFLASIFS